MRKNLISKYFGGFSKYLGILWKYAIWKIFQFIHISLYVYILHGFLFHSVGYYMLLSLYFDVHFILLDQWVIIQGGCVLQQCLHQLVEHFIALWHNMMFQAHFVLSLSQLWNQSFLKGSPYPRREEWYLGERTGHWVYSLLLEYSNGPFEADRSRECMYLSTQITHRKHIHICTSLFICIENHEFTLKWPTPVYCNRVYFRFLPFHIYNSLLWQWKHWPLLFLICLLIWLISSSCNSAVSAVTPFPMPMSSLPCSGSDSTFHPLLPCDLLHPAWALIPYARPPVPRLPCIPHPA